MKNLLKKTLLRKQLPQYDGFKGETPDVQLYEVPHQSLSSLE